MPNAIIDFFVYTYTSDKADHSNLFNIYINDIFELVNHKTNTDVVIDDNINVTVLSADVPY